MPPSLSFVQFRDSLERGVIVAAYLFEGEEAYFHEAGIRALEESVLPREALSIDRESLRGDETSLAAILDLAATYPMVGGRRLIVVRQAAGLRSDTADSLEAYLKSPNPKSCLVFSDTEFDRRRAVYRTLLKHAARVDCRPLDEARTAAWVRERLRGRGFGISADLASAVAEGLAGAGLGRVEVELEKLMSSIGSPRPVEAADLSLLADVPRVEDAFRLAAHTARGDTGEAIVSVRALLRSGEDAIKLLGGLSWYFRNAIRAVVAGERRLPPREATQIYGIDRGRIERFAREIGRARVEDLRDALRSCLKMDRELKGQGAKDPANALERLVHQVGRRARRTA
ncbi:MAG: DNA polymerase III subunit delta [Acidobacteria bacterium 13_1_40CM_4_69_4]|nr:MAG: DNA polymerase III subunit delta [Acidobacteria bacterium 13_1_40CM_4_69_4]